MADAQFVQQATAAEVVFLHERTATNGKRRLVVVHRDPVLNELRAAAFRPGSIAANPRRTFVGRTVIHRTIYLPGFDPDETNFRGQPDADDPSHFTIVWSALGQYFVADGRLREDESVALSLRPNPFFSTDPPAYDPPLPLPVPTPTPPTPGSPE